MTPKKALDQLDRTFIGDLKLKIELSKALEKQIPKKPNERHSKKCGDKYNDGECPNCGATYSDGLSETPLYCSQCGQAFDWSDENEK
jgi:protein-arginine kinase activator protein McsA